MRHDDEITSLWAIFSRVYWMMIGPLGLVLLAFTIIRAGTGWLTWIDLGYLAMLGGMLLARWWEFREGRAKTTDGQPAAPADLRRYVQQAASLGLVMWVVANLLGNHLLNP
jgi:hypothetical protein